MKSIYDMMGRHTYPILREDAPLEHVERFFHKKTQLFLGGYLCSGLQGPRTRTKEVPCEFASRRARAWTTGRKNSQGTAPLPHTSS